MSNKSFLGTGWAFPVRFDAQTKHTHMVSTEDDIRQSLYILLSTRPGERLMHPNFGCELHTVVFESISQTLISEVKDVVARAILFYEPRINLLGIEVDTNPELYLEGKINLYLEYLVRQTNSRSNMVFPYYFMEGTDL